MLPDNTLDRYGATTDFPEPEGWNRCLHPLEDRERRPTGAIWQAQYAESSILAGPYPDGPLTTQTTLASAPSEIALGFDRDDVLYLAWQDEAGVWLWQDGDLLRLLGCTSPRLTRDGEDDLLFFYLRPDTLLPDYPYAVCYRSSSQAFDTESAIAVVPEDVASINSLGMTEEGRLQMSFCGVDPGCCECEDDDCACDGSDAFVFDIDIFQEMFDAIQYQEGGDGGCFIDTTGFWFFIPFHDPLDENGDPDEDFVYDFCVDWGDGCSTHYDRTYTYNSTGEPGCLGWVLGTDEDYYFDFWNAVGHCYKNPGSYTVKICGTVTAPLFSEYGKK